MIELETILKDIKRVIGKKRYNKSVAEATYFISIRSKGDAEICLNTDSTIVLRKYMQEHKKSRLNKTCCDLLRRNGKYFFRFEVRCN